MPAPLRRPISAASALLVALLAAPVAGAAEDLPAGLGSPTLCLFEATPVNDRRLLINLAHIQYVEVRNDEVRIYYGGGKLGNGHEAHWPVRSKDEAAALIRRMQDAARACR